MSKTLGFLAGAADMFAKPPAPKWTTPGDLAQTVSPDTVQTPAMILIDNALMELANTPNGRLIISMPPQEGKSTRAAEVFPLWVLSQRPSTRIVLVSHSIVLARRNSRNVRHHIDTHGEQLSLWLSRDVNSATEWQLAGHRGGVYAVGMGGSLTGRPSDLMILDDPIKDMEAADSEVIRENAWDWWMAVGSTRQSPGSQVVLIQTRWHDDDIAGRLMAAPDGHRWKLLNIPAQADHNPEKGEVDVLGREPGQYMVSAQGVRDWEEIKAERSARYWSAMYQGSPAPVTGGILKRNHWRYYHEPLWTTNEAGQNVVTGEGDTLIQSWDMTFKNTKASDYVVGQVWLKRGPNAYLLAQTRRRMTFTESVHAVDAMTAMWPQADVKLIEDKANGTAVLDVLRSRLSGLIPVTPHESKSERAAAVAWAVEAGNVFLPDLQLAPWIDELVEETTAFPTGAHDDQVDALTQALNRLMINAGAGVAWMEYGRRVAERQAQSIKNVGGSDGITSRVSARNRPIRSERPV